MFLPRLKLALASSFGAAMLVPLIAVGLSWSGVAQGAPTPSPTTLGPQNGAKTDGPAPSWMMAGVDPAKGEGLYKERCSGCHDSPTGRTPSKAMISGNTPAYIFGVLTEGIMRPYAEGLSQQDRMAIALHVSKNQGRGTVDRSSSETPACTDAPPALTLSGPVWNGWGAGPTQLRFQPDPGLKAADVPRLKLKWAIGMNGARNGQPVIAGGRLFTTNTSGTVYSLNARTGCAYWRFNASAGSRNTISLAPLPKGSGARIAAYFVDATANLYALDAETGRQLWKTKVDTQPATQFTGSVIVHDGLVYVPVSSAEEALATSDAYECCKFRGAVVAVDAVSGRLRWTTYMTQTPPRPFKKNAKGTQMYGPAGGAIWSAPTVDAKRGLLYVATGDSYTDVPHEGADAVVAMDLKTGAIRWINQVTTKDSYIIGCGPPGTRRAGGETGAGGAGGRQRGPDRTGANCPSETGGDYDFGMTPILHTQADGKQLILVGQKSSEVYALDPDQTGKVVWRHRLSPGAALGGVEFGGAADRDTLYIGIADLFLGPAARPGLTAFRISDGKILWSAPSPKLPCRWTNIYCDPAISMAVTAMPGAVFAGSMNGRLRAYDSTTGKVVWEVDTAGAPYTSISGRETLGGALDGSGPVIAGGMVFVHSGYWARSGPGGTVLLAYSVDGK